MYRRVLAAVMAGTLLLAPAPAHASIPPVGSVEGLVLDHGRPVEGARVCPPFADGCNIPITTTDADGHFRLDGLHSGSTTLLVTSPGGGLKELYPGEGDPPLVVPDDGVTWMVKRNFGPHGAIAGRITTNSGAPVGGAVLLLPIYRHYMTTKTDASGYYKLDFLPEVTSRVSIQPDPSQRLTEWVPRKKVEGEGAEITTKIGKTLRLDERLLPMGTVTGTLTDATGAAVPGNVITDDASATIGADGSFSMRVFAGDHRLQYGYDSDRVQWATGTIAQQDATVFHIGEDRVVHHDEKVIAQGAIRGRALDWTGEPAGVQLLDRYGVSLRYVGTDSDGNWSVPALGVGTYQVRYTYASRGLEVGLFTVVAGQTTTVPDTKMLEPGKLTIKATLDGVELKEFCVFLRYHVDVESTGGCVEDGVFVAEQVSPYTFDVNVTTALGDYGKTVPATVASGRETVVTVPLSTS